MRSSALPARIDVVIIGGGTAGSAAARLLASWGHQVLMVERELTRPPLAESLPPSCIPLLERIGVREAVDAADFVRGRGNTVWWGGEPMRVEPFAGGRVGYQVARDRLEQILATSAESAGVIRLRPATVVRVQREADTNTIDVSRPDGRLSVQAPWVLDCSGRAGLMARATRITPPPSVRTIALVGVWQREGGWSLPDDTHTLVESAAWGWGWSVPLDAVSRCFTAMVDPHATPLVGEDGLLARYDALFDALPALGPIMHGARRVGTPWACEATPYHSHEVAPLGALLVGDAASMIDPLSSFGVKKALASAWLAAVVVHTDLVTPAHTEDARTLFREREAAYVHSASRALGGLSRDAEAGREAPFWSARANGHASDDNSASGNAAHETIDADDLTTRENGVDPAVQLRSDPAVLRAFAMLRETSVLHARVASDVVRHRRPVVRGNVVVPDEHLALPGLNESLRYLRSVDLLELLEVAQYTTDVGAMYERYSRRAGPVPLPDFLGALSVLFAKGILQVA